MVTKIKKGEIKKIVTAEMKNIGLVGLGLIVGNQVGKFIDKQLAIDPSTAKLTDIKTFVSPIVVTSTGVLTRAYIENENIKLLALGIGTSGAVSGVKRIASKVLPAGLGNISEIIYTEDLGSPMYVVDDYPMGAYNEPLDMSIERYSPNLPLLSLNPPSDMNYTERADEVSGVEGMDESGDYTDYKEII